MLGLGLGVLLLQRWVGSDDFRGRLQAQAEAVLGVPVALGRLHVDPWPVPAVALDQVVLRTRAPLTAERIELRLRLSEMLAGRLEVTSLVLRDADLPQQGIDELLAAINRKADASRRPGSGQSGKAVQDAASALPLALIARRLSLENLTWRNNRGEATTISADADLDLLGVPNAVNLAVSAGSLQGARVTAKRRHQPTGRPQGELRGVQQAGDSSQLADGAAVVAEPSWDIRIDHAGGTIEGPLTVRLPASGQTQLSVQGQFETRNMQLSALRKGAPGPLSGRLQASTSLSAKAESTAELAAVLVSHSRFTVQDAVVNGVDLAKAVQTVGLSRGGQTRLDNLSGQVTTRGRAIQLSNLAASSGALSATGELAVAPNRALSGRVKVNLAEKLVGKAIDVPLVVGGTLDAPTVTLTRSAMLGAAIGTLVMPGVGTGAGATVGEAIGEKLKGLFGK